MGVAIPLLFRVSAGLGDFEQLGFEILHILDLHAFSFLSVNKERPQPCWLATFGPGLERIGGVPSILTLRVANQGRMAMGVSMREMEVLRREAPGGAGQAGLLCPK